MKVKVAYRFAIVGNGGLVQDLMSIRGTRVGVNFLFFFLVGVSA